jgi:hypothetical protein
MAARVTNDAAARPRRRGACVSGAILAVACSLAACGGATGSGAIAPPAVATIGPLGTVGPEVVQTRAELVRVLGTRNLVLQDSQAAFRPPEDSRFTATPRALYQVVLPDAPTEGFIVVYQFPDPVEASEAASAQARYLATGPAKVQSAFGARHILRLVGSTVVMYSWVPNGVADPRQPDIQVALETLGTGVLVPS